MNSIGIGYVLVGILGLVMGSFAGATVWRLRARQLIEDKSAGESVNRAELRRLKPLTKTKLASDRSRCLECRHVLAWYDLIPIVSWLSTKGRCRYCQKPIGWFEPAIELGTAAAFVAGYAYWLAWGNMMVPLLILWLVVITMLAILFVYDTKWFLLPDAVMFPLIGCAFIIAAIRIVGSTDISVTALSTFGAVVILGGLYLALWLISKGAWVGFGDVKLGLALGLLLGDWKLALLALFLANLIGTLIVLPGLVTKKMTRGTHVPFGPLLIAGFLVSLLAGEYIIGLYSAMTYGFVAVLLML